MKIHALVEGPSEKCFLERWGQRMLPGHELKVHPHQGKGKLPRPEEVGTDALRKRRGLLDQLPAKLSAFGKSPQPEEARVVVLIDADDQDVKPLKASLQALRDDLAPNLKVEFCFAIEELEAFYLGDLKAMKAAYPQHKRQLATDYVPDSICGTWELFGRVIDDDSGNKVAWATMMGSKLTTKPNESRSPSFRAFCRALKRLTALPPSTSSRTKKPRKAKVATTRDATGKRAR